MQYTQANSARAFHPSIPPRFVSPGDVLAVPHVHEAPHVAQVASQQVGRKASAGGSSPTDSSATNSFAAGSADQPSAHSRNKDPCGQCNSAASSSPDGSADQHSRHNRHSREEDPCGQCSSAVTCSSDGGVDVTAVQSRPCWLFVVADVEPRTPHPLRVNPLSGATEVSLTVRKGCVRVCARACMYGLRLW